ncbi:MAG: hypothetical protein ACOC1O_05390 [bacterium]
MRTSLNEDDEYFEVSIRYILERAESDIIEKDEIIEEVKRIIPERSKKIMTIADELRKDGVNEMLIRQLENILNQEIPQDIKQKMEKTDNKKLMEIGVNIMEINTLNDLREKLK